jgi:hypothetical protein
MMGQQLAGGNMVQWIDFTRKVLMIGGWAPLMVFSIHAIASRVFHVYEAVPQADIPMHFAGGVAIAFFISRCFRALPRDVVRSSRVIVLEAVLVASLTTTAAVLWEFAEFLLDSVSGTNVQVSLANTMKDLAFGMLGAMVFIAVRARRLRAGAAELRDVAADWMSGRAA